MKRNFFYDQCMTGYHLSYWSMALRVSTSSRVSALWSLPFIISIWCVNLWFLSNNLFKITTHIPPLMLSFEVDMYICLFMGQIFLPTFVILCHLFNWYDISWCNFVLIMYYYFILNMNFYVKCFICKMYFLHFMILNKWPFFVSLVFISYSKSSSDSGLCLRSMFMVSSCLS